MGKIFAHAQQGPSKAEFAALTGRLRSEAPAPFVPVPPPAPKPASDKNHNAPTGWAVLLFGLPLMAAIATALYLWGKAALMIGGVVALSICWKRAPLTTLLGIFVLFYFAARH